ncbi:MAG: hypothetical protein HXY40_17970 [Chloroflexi bacterium]|nr:hypothetical protein [Chloroflexota bacterium]
MGIFNQYSFFAAAATVGLILAAALWLGLRALPALRDRPRGRALLLGTLLALYAGGVVLFNLSRQYPASSVQTTAEVDAVLSSGRPTFVMLYSNY